MKAVVAVKRGISLKKAEKEFGVHLRSIKNKGDNADSKKAELQFSRNCKKQNLHLVCKSGEWRQLLNKHYMNMITASILKLNGITVSVLQQSENVPGKD